MESGIGAPTKSRQAAIVLVCCCIGRVWGVACGALGRARRVSPTLTVWPPGETGSVSPCGEAKKVIDTMWGIWQGPRQSTRYGTAATRDANKVTVKNTCRVGDRAWGTRAWSEREKCFSPEGLSATSLLRLLTLDTHHHLSSFPFADLICTQNRTQNLGQNVFFIVLRMRWLCAASPRALGMESPQARG